MKVYIKLFVFLRVIGGIMKNSIEFKVIGAIDVGSNYIRMVIAEVTGGKDRVILEELKKLTNAGKDSFNTGRISVETIHEICHILSGYKRIMKEYGVKKYKAVATSGIREADNREYVLEQIRLSTGLKVEIINNSEERLYVYKALRDDTEAISLIKSTGTLIVNVSSGGLEVSVYENGKLKYTDYIKLGTLRIREILSELELNNINFARLMKEYIESKLNLLQQNIIRGNIKNYIALGGELDTILKLANGSIKENWDKRTLASEELYSIYKEILKHSNEQLVEKYGISNNVSELLIPSVLIFYSFLKIVDAEIIYAPMISLRHGILIDIEDGIFDLPRKKDVINDVISSVWFIAEKYNINKSHSKFVRNIALSIFDQLKSLHKLGERERLFLEIAAILHDVGKYVSFNGNSVHSYNIIRKQNIIGFSDREMEIVANVARYHSYKIPRYSHENYVNLIGEDRIIVSKLVAIFRIAEALDISHKQKIQEISISNTREGLFFNINSKDDITLEKWDFNRKASFFGELMGIEPKIQE